MVLWVPSHTLKALSKQFKASATGYLNIRDNPFLLNYHIALCFQFVNTAAYQRFSNFPLLSINNPPYQTNKACFYLSLHSTVFGYIIRQQYDIANNGQWC